MTKQQRQQPLDLAVVMPPQNLICSDNTPPPEVTSGSPNGMNPKRKWVDGAFLAVCLPLLGLASIAHVYLLLSWEAYKRRCFVPEGAPRDSTTLSLVVWLTGCNLWLTNASILGWILRLTRAGGCHTKSTSEKEQANVEGGKSTETITNTNVADRESSGADPPLIEHTVVGDSRFAKAHRSIFQIALPISLTTMIAYTGVLIAQPPNESLEIDHDACLSISDSVISRAAPGAQMWLYMDRIFSATAHFLCAFFLLFLFLSRRIGFNANRWFLALPFATGLALVIGLVHTFHSPVYAVDNIWLAALLVVVACTVLEGISKMIWFRYLS